MWKKNKKNEVRYCETHKIEGYTNLIEKGDIDPDPDILMLQNIHVLLKPFCDFFCKKFASKENLYLVNLH